MMTMDDDQSEAVDWGDGDDVPDENAESIAVEADAVSLASDDQDDLEALKKYHQNTWDDSREPATSEPTVSQSTPAAPPAQESPERNNSSPSNSAPNVHGLPPKPSSNVYSKGPPSNVVSTSATAMAPRNTGPNGNHSSPEVRQSLPPGWEIRTSKGGKDYYYNIEAGTTQWDLPTETLRPTRSASSRERGKRVDRSRRSRSRSRERRVARRSLSPPRPTYRPRSRSLERDVSHRVARQVSPKRESSRVSRERHAPRVRSRPSSRERRPSPKPSRAVERRSRSPPRARDSRDRQEPHSSRHRSPIPRVARSQEGGDSYRPGHHPAKPPPTLDIDRQDQAGHGTVRRRRSWGSPDASDIKRRRVAASPPPPRGVDRYVPDRSSRATDTDRSFRMDIDPPSSRQETKRSTITNVYDGTRELRQALPDPPPLTREKRDDRPRDAPSSRAELSSKDRRDERPRETQQSQPLPQPPPRERRDHPAGDREYRSTTSQGQRTSPPPTLNAIEPAPSVSRSRVPLPPQAELMRHSRGGSKKASLPPPPSRYAPMDVDVSEGASRPSTSERPTARNVDRARGRGRSKSPHSRPYDDDVGRSKGGPSTYDQPPRVDRALHREVVESRNGVSSRPPLPLDPYNANQRGRSSKSTGSLSTSNTIPLAHPKEFGGSPANIRNDEATPVENPSTSSSAPNEATQNSDQVPKRQRQSRFGPKVDNKPNEIDIPESKPEPSHQEEPRPVQREESPQQDAIRSPALDEIASKSVTLQRPRATQEEFQRDSPPHTAGLEQDVRRVPYTRREDGLRIDRNRTSTSEPTERSEPSLETNPESAGAAVGEIREAQDVPEPTSHPNGTTGESLTLSPPVEVYKPAERQTTLLERISIPVEYDEDGAVIEVDEGGATGTDKRKSRGRRPNRGARR